MFQAHLENDDMGSDQYRDVNKTRNCREWKAEGII
jgi:hypothetical protein